MRLLLVAVLLCAVVSAQAPSFDVVSIKPNKSGSGSMSVGVRGGRFTAVNATALTLVQNGYFPADLSHLRRARMDDLRTLRHLRDDHAAGHAIAR